MAQRQEWQIVQSWFHFTYVISAVIQAFGTSWATNEG